MRDWGSCKAVAPEAEHRHAYIIPPSADVRDNPVRHRAALDALIKRLPWFRERPSLDLAIVHPALPYPAAAAWVGKDVAQR